MLAGVQGGPRARARKSPRAVNRSGRERLIRYCLRGPLALERLSRLPGGLIAYRTKYGRGQRTHLILTPVELLARLSSLIPPPRLPLLRYFTAFGYAEPRGPTLTPSSGLDSVHSGSACLHRTVPIGIVSCQRIRRANSLTSRTRRNPRDRASPRSLRSSSIQTKAWAFARRCPMSTERAKHRGTLTGQPC